MNQQILIADDDRIQRDILQFLLNPDKNNNTFNIQLFEDGMPLVQFFEDQFRQANRIPLCILDMCMINLGGFETAQAIREIDPEVFIIIVTSVEGISIDKLMNGLKDDVYFMKKPVRREEFLALVNSLLVNWNKQQDLREAYQNLSYAQRQLQNFIENTPVPVALLDTEIRYITYSQRWLKECKLENQTLSGKFHYELFPNIPKRWKQEHQRCLKGEIIKYSADKIISPDGSEEFVKRELYPWFKSNKEIGGIIIFIEFITEQIKESQVRQKTQEKIQENEAYLKAIMAAIQTSVMIIDAQTYKITDVNPCASKMLGRKRKDLIGSDFYDFKTNYNLDESMFNNEYILKRPDDRNIHVHRSIAKAKIGEREYLVQSLLDITDIKAMMKKQEISIDLAKKLLHMINGDVPRYTFLSKNRAIFAEALCAPCFKEGGDHYFIRTIPNMNKTIISLKDQSGHEVGCVLRSIMTDLLHHCLLNKNQNKKSGLNLESLIKQLNNIIYKAGFFNDCDFFTGINAEIDHNTLELKYISAGHPPFFLIRGADVFSLPEPGRPGKNLPIPINAEAKYSAGTFPLKTGDKLLFYTDGLTDMPRANNGKSIAFKELKHIIYHFAAQNPDQPVSELMRAVLKKISDKSQVNIVPFSKNTSNDDITLLCLEIEDQNHFQEKILKPENSGMLYQMINMLYLELLEELKNQKYKISEIGIRSIVSESVLNAWHHGNKQDPQKNIQVRWRYGNDFHFQVIDQGKGFEIDAVPEIKSEKNLMKSSGRGLQIIQHYSDKILFKKGCPCLKICIQKYPNLFKSGQLDPFIRLW